MDAIKNATRRRWVSSTTKVGVNLLRDFATPVAFFVTFREAGAKPAISLALATTFLQVIYHRWKGLKFSPFFIVASGFTTLFGTIDLVVDQPRYFRLEPFVQNTVMGTLFLATVFLRIPIAHWFLGALPEKIRPDLSKMKVSYTQNLTVIWAVYFYIKAVIFLYLALTVDLGQLILLRSVIGSLSLALMFAGEIYYRRRYYSGS